MPLDMDDMRKDEGASCRRSVLIYSESWNYGGIVSFIMDTIRHLDRERFDFTIFSTWDCNNDFDAELDELGVSRRVVFPGRRPNLLIRQVASLRGMRELLRDEHFDIVHVNTMNGMGFAYSQVAKKGGVDGRIVHSHGLAFGAGHRFLKSVAHAFGKKRFGSSANVRLACSRAAGEYLFGDKTFEIVNNAIEIDRFKFDEGARRRTRRQLGIGDSTFLMGNVGRIAAGKNPLFQLEVFAELHRLRPDSAYLMVGNGDMEGQVRERAEEIGLADRVILTGGVADPGAYYSALDAFLLPSRFDGLATVRIEAQCAGVPLLISSDLPKEGDITDLVEHLDLSDAPSEWARRLADMADLNHDRSRYAALVAASGFSIEGIARRLDEIYSLQQ